MTMLIYVQSTKRCERVPKIADQTFCLLNNSWKSQIIEREALI